MNSYIRDGFGLRPIEVELSVVPGLPQLKFLGLPDILIRESEARIKTALRKQGFSIPSSKQILVQLRPSEIKKHSRGLDLAVAAAFLWETEQIPKPERKNIFLYGELNFNGEVRVPDDFSDLETIADDSVILTGESQLPFGIDRLMVRELKDLSMPLLKLADQKQNCFTEPSIESSFLSQEQARLALIIATGEHPTLLAGPPGSGKSTLADYISKIIIPDTECAKECQQIARYFGEKLEWIPVRRPHHKSTLLSMIGAGRPPEPGEITRAHGGVLIMDEFLEFDSKIQEALREPMEMGRIQVSRAGQSKEFPAKFLLLATTNLCPCGQLAPTPQNRCICRTVKKRFYLEKLSGPILDRFHIVSFSHKFSQEHDTPLIKVKEQVHGARAFALKTRNQVCANGRTHNINFFEDLSCELRTYLKASVSSQRRLKSLSQLARTIADIDQKAKIQEEHIHEALLLSQRGVQRMQIDIQKFI